MPDTDKPRFGVVRLRKEELVCKLAEDILRQSGDHPKEVELLLVDVSKEGQRASQKVDYRVRALVWELHKAPQCVFVMLLKSSSIRTGQVDAAKTRKQYRESMDILYSQGGSWVGIVPSSNITINFNANLKCCIGFKTFLCITGPLEK